MHVFHFPCLLECGFASKRACGRQLCLIKRTTADQESRAGDKKSEGGRGERALPRAERAETFDILIILFGSPFFQL